MSEPQLTKERVLRESRPLWIDSPRITVRSARKAASRSYDVIIVGAGISGALLANALTRPGRSVLVIDRRAAVSGSSIASTAMIQHEIDVPLHRLRRMIGQQKADRAWRRSAKAVLALEEIVRTRDISCSFRRKKALYLAGDDMGARALKQEVEARNAAGIEADFIGAAALREGYDIDRTGAILSDISASANPGQLTAGLLRDAARRGAEIVTGVEITDLDSFGGGVSLATDEGRLLRAAHVVFCTGYEFLKSLESRKHRIISTWALASKPGLDLPPWVSDHILWEASDPYLYLRTDSDGRVIAGGEDEDSPDAHTSLTRLHAKAETIRLKVGRLLGRDIGPAQYRWAAAFGSTTTGLPLIGRVPGMDNVHSVMGFGGNGITFSQIAAEIVSADIEGSQDPDAELFRPE